MTGERRRADPCGVLVVAKPSGPTSHDVVALVRRLSGVRRVGHGGTLDPFASGVLPVFIGRATRLVEYHLADRKRYRATVCFGARSSTDDLDGELIPTGVTVDRDAVEAALAGMSGEIDQVPPAYSAVKVGGRRAYALARAGRPVVLAPRRVTLDRLAVVGWDGSDRDRPVATIEVDCSAGTYVRAIARDLGEATGGGAYLGALVRLASGPFTLDGAVTLDAIRTAAAGPPPGLAGLFVDPSFGLDRFPTIVLEPEGVADVARGRFVRPARSSDTLASADGRVRVVDQAGRLVAIARLADGRLAPEKVLIDPSDDVR